MILLAETRCAVAAPTRTVVCRSGVWAEDPRRVCLVSSRSGEPNRSVFSRLHVRSVRLRCWGALVRCFCLLVFPVVPLRSLLAFFLLPAPTEIVDCAEQLLRSAAARTGPWCLRSARLVIVSCRRPCRRERPGTLARPGMEMRRVWSTWEWIGCLGFILFSGFEFCVLGFSHLKQHNRTEFVDWLCCSHQVNWVFGFSFFVMRVTSRALETAPWV